MLNLTPVEEGDSSPEGALPKGSVKPMSMLESPLRKFGRHPHGWRSFFCWRLSECSAMLLVSLGRLAVLSSHTDSGVYRSGVGSFFYSTGGLPIFGT